jgi:hypothetical protein
MKKISVVLQDSMQPVVSFDGDYTTKRELMLVLRAVKRAHLESIKEYRRKLIIKEYEESHSAAQKGNTDGTDGSGSSGVAKTAGTVGTGEQRGTVGGLSGSVPGHAAEAAVAAAADNISAESGTSQVGGVKTGG